MQEPAKKTSKLPFILIGCAGLLFVLIFIGGTLAAIAIPAFLRYIKQTKIVEAEINTPMIANLFAGQYLTDCAFPPSAAPSSAVPMGGEKVQARFTGPGWDVIEVPFNQMETYFAYRTENRGDTLAVIAEADFNKGGPKHTVTVLVAGTKDESHTCTVDVGNTMSENEME